MKKSLLLVALLLWSLPVASLASENEKVTGKLNTEVWHLDTEVMLNGTNLQGPMPSQSKLCFAPEANQEHRLCFKLDHPNITKSSVSNLTFVPPGNTPPMGVVVLVHPYSEYSCETLYGKLKCKTTTEREIHVVAKYKAHPHIANVIDRATGEEPIYIKEGNTYEITGYRFGDSGVGIYINKKMIDKPDILRWTHDSIVFKAAQSYFDTADIEVHNGGGRGTAWRIQGQNNLLTQTKTRTRGTVIERNTVAASVVTQEKEESTAPKEALFRDVGIDHPYYKAIAWAKNENVLQGYSNGTFQGTNDVSRVEYLKILIEADGPKDIMPLENGLPFIDIDPDAWYAPYVNFAKKEGIVEGYANGLFLPEKAVTTAEALKMAYRFLKIPTLDPKGDAWFSRYAEHALANNILFETRMDPSAPMKRQDTVWMVWKLIQWKNP